MKKESHTNTSSFDTFKIWLNRSEKSSITDIRLASKYASVGITLKLTFLKRITF